MLPLIAFIFGLLSIFFSSTGSTAEYGFGIFCSAIAVLLTIASIASYTYIRFGTGISVGCTLAAIWFASILPALSLNCPEALLWFITFGLAVFQPWGGYERVMPTIVTIYSYNEYLGMLYGVVSLILLIIGIDIMSIYVVGRDKPIVVPRLITDAIKTARTTKERFAGGDES